MHRILRLGAIAVLACGLTACLPAGTRGTGTGGSGTGGAQPTAEPTPAPPTGPTPTPSYVPPTPTPAPTFVAVVVTKGDSLNTIAHEFGTTARSIAFWNRATYPSLDPESASYKPGFIQPGWTLVLLPNQVVDEQELPDPSEAGPEPSAS